MTKTIKELLLEATDNNILVYDDSVESGMTERLVLLMVQTMVDNYNQGIETIYYDDNHTGFLGYGDEWPLIIKYVKVEESLKDLYKSFDGYSKKKDENIILAVGKNGTLLLGNY